MGRLHAALIFLLFATIPTASAQTSKPTLFQKPTISQTSIVFAYAGDLWTVARDGGSARRLTSGTGIESDPMFSPDGSAIAFTGQYDGNTDVFVIPAEGGVPKRLTFHPGDDEVAGWSNDGKQVLFRSSRNSTSGFNRLFTMPLAGGLPSAVPLPMANEGAYSPDGAFLAYQPISQWQPDWKRYRGGQQGRIWIARLSDSTVERIPRENSNDRNPMWAGDRIYFLSDRSGPVTLFAYDTKTKKVVQAVRNEGLDIKSASAGPDAIVYEQFGTIWTLDLKSGATKKIAIDLDGDFAGVRPRFEKVGSRIAAASISPTGARAVFEARGEIITVPAEKGDPRNLTNSPGVMERSPVWSPDGKWIAYFSDESGEYALHLRDQKGVGETKKIDLGTPPSFYYALAWAPDSKKLAYSDRRFNLWYVDVEKGTPVKVDTNLLGFNNSTMEPRWAPDSKWIAYAKHLPNTLRAIFVYSLDTAKFQQITDGLGDAAFPVFDRDGKYLHFTASTNVGPALSWADLSGIDHQSTRSVYTAVLRNDLPSPLAPESDEEKIAEDKKDEKKPEPPAGAAAPAQAPPAAETKPDAAKGPEPVRIDFDGLGQRIIALPVPPRNFVALAAGKAGTLFLLEAPPATLSGGFQGPPGLTLDKFDFEKRKFDKVTDGVLGFDLSANGEKMLLNLGFSWTIASAMAPPQPGQGMLQTSEMQAYVDPRAEWRQMFKEAWRGERDFFYDPNHHGLDLRAAERLYAPYVEAVAHRADLNYLFREMLNQLTIGHMFVGGGDAPQPNFVPGGLLGCDYSIENGRYRFARVYNGENWNPQLRAPLTQPGVNVKAGEYLLAVNGRELRSADNVYQFFESTAGKQIVIKVGASPDGTNAREVTVVPVGNEYGLRNLAWIEDNRRKVDEMSGGRLAYVYVPDTSAGGYTSFNRYFFAQTDRDGAVVDERFNGGGLLADYIVNYLSRPQLSAIRFRYGSQDVAVPGGAIYGPKAMLINEMAGSGGDALPWYFKKMKIGPLIGTRTWGGLVAAFPGPSLMDGGFNTAPDAGVYGLEGQWEVENAGVGPDIEVEFDPALWRQGRDPQLERAIQYLLDELKKNPRPRYQRPPYPVYKRGKDLDQK